MAKKDGVENFTFWFKDLKIIKMRRLLDTFATFRDYGIIDEMIEGTITQNVKEYLKKIKEEGLLE